MSVISAQQSPVLFFGSKDDVLVTYCLLVCWWCPNQEPSIHPPVQARRSLLISRNVITLLLLTPLLPRSLGRGTCLLHLKWTYLMNLYRVVLCATTLQLVIRQSFSCPSKAHFTAQPRSIARLLPFACRSHSIRSSACSVACMSLAGVWMVRRNGRSYTTFYYAHEMSGQPVSGSEQ